MSNSYGQIYFLSASIMSAIYSYCLICHVQCVAECDDSGPVNLITLSCASCCPSALASYSE